MEEVTVKRNFGQGLSNCINGLRKTPLPLVRTVLKASISVLISLILVLVHKTRVVIGPASTMVTLGTLLYFPVKPVGKCLAYEYFNITAILIMYCRHPIQGKQ
jgi:hypothetical protein